MMMTMTTTTLQIAILVCDLAIVRLTHYSPKIADLIEFYAKFKYQCAPRLPIEPTNEMHFFHAFTVFHLSVRARWRVYVLSSHRHLSSILLGESVRPL